MSAPRSITERQRAVTDEDGVRGERGAVLVEFSMVIAIFAAFLFALVGFGMVLALKHSITQAAHEGARAAVGAVPADRVTVAEGKVADSLDWLGTKYDPADTVATTGFIDGNDDCDTSGATTTGAQCIVVTITYPYDSRPLLPTLPFVDRFMPDQLQSTATVLLSYD